MFIYGWGVRETVEDATVEQQGERRERINWVNGRSELFLIRDNGIWLLDRYE